MSEILNTKTQSVFCCLNENSTTFSYTLNKGDKKTEGEKKIFFKVYKKVEIFLTRKNSFLVLIFGFSLSNE